MWLLPGTSTGDPSVTPISTVSSPVSATTPGTETSPGTQTTPGTTSIVPTATATVTPENLRAGDGCTWQQEGDRRTGVDGAALVCNLAYGSYQWRPPG
jgi:hypothetical protein